MAKDTYESTDPYEAPKDGLGNALIVLTTIILLIAVIVIQKAMAAKYDAGMFGEGGKAVPAAPAPTPPAMAG